MMSDITNKYDECVAGSISLKVFSIHPNDLIGPKLSVINKLIKFTRIELKTDNA